MVTVIYNISNPEQGGVGRYTYELLKRLRKTESIKEIDLSPSFGNTKINKLASVTWRRKKLLNNNIAILSDVNHFTQAEIFYPQKEKTIITMHNPPPSSKIFSYKYGMYGRIRDIFYARRYNLAVKKGDFLIANSELTKEKLIESGADKDRIKVIHLGIDSSYSIKKPFDSRQNIIGYVGSFAPHKRVDIMLKDFINSTITSKYKIRLYGSGGESLDKKYSDNSIEFMGSRDSLQLVEAYNSMKAFVLPSVGESFGLPILEALACGTPVFIYEDSIISPEISKHCFKIETVSQIPKILEEVDNSKMEKISKNVQKQFNWNRNVKETINLYKEI